MIYREKVGDLVINEFSAKEKMQLVDQVTEIKGISYQDAKKLLSESNWDIYMLINGYKK